MRLRLSWLERWTWKRAAVGATVVAVTVGGALGATALAGQATAAPAPPRFGDELALDQDEAKKGFLGIIIAQLNDQLAQKLGISQTTGVVVVDVSKDSPAEKAGVQAKDILLKVNGTAVADMKAAREAIGAVQPGGTVTLTVQRNGQEQTLTATAGEAPVLPKGRPGMPKPPFPPMAGGFGLALPGLKELEGILPQDMFSHMQSGTMTFTDKDGKPVTVTATFGTVTAVDTTASTVTVQPNSGGAVTYAVGQDTVIRGNAKQLVQLKAGDKVTVVTVNGSNEARMIMGMPQPPAAKAGQGKDNGGPNRQRFEFRLPGGLPGALNPGADGAMFVPDLDALRDRPDMPQLRASMASMIYK